MSKTKLSLLLLVSSLTATKHSWAKSVDSHTKDKHSCTDSYCHSNKKSSEKHPQQLDEAFDEFSTKLEQSVRSSILNFMETTQDEFNTIHKKTQEELNRVHTELQSVGDRLKEKIALTQTKLIEEADKIKLDFQLPSEFKFESANNVDVVNDKIISLSLKDEKHSISINCILDKNRIKGQIRIESTEVNDKGVSKKSHQEASFDHRVFIGKTNLENLTVDFDKERHTLTFSIPKEFETEVKRSVKISVK